MQMREKVGKSRNTVFFQWFVASEGRKVGLAKAAGAEPSGQTRDEKLHALVARSTFPSQNAQSTTDHFLEVEMSEKCMPLWREAHFQVKMHKTHHCRTTFGSCDVEKCARRCGAKHISKSKCTKPTMLGPLLEVAISKKCTLLWREAPFEVKMYKTPHVRATFGGSDVEKVHTVVARSTFRSQHVKSTRGSDHFWKLRCRKSARRWREAHFEVKLLKTPGFRTTFGGSDVASLRFASLHYTTLHYITLHYTPLHYITLHYTPQHYNYNYTTTQLHSTTLNYTTLHYLYYTPLHSTTLHYTTFTTFHYTSLNYTTLHSTTLQLQLQLHNYTTTLHYTPLH